MKMKPIGYVELPSYEVIDLAANALDNISVAIAKEAESRKENDIDQFLRRLFLKIRSDEECSIKKVLQSAKSTDKVLLSIETHNILLNWA